MAEIKTRKSNVAEKKVGGSYKMRPSIKLEAMEHIKKDSEIKSFNDFLEVATVAYIKAQKELRKDDNHKNQGTLYL